jgi:hypothetical protein
MARVAGEGVARLREEDRVAKRERGGRKVADDGAVVDRRGRRMRRGGDAKRTKRDSE